MSINIIVAKDLSNGIGFNNELLCKLPSDMKHFRELTENNFIVMGRKTLESIGHPLPNRTNIILSRNKDYKPPLGSFAYHSIEDVISAYNNQNNNESELFFIGGSEIFYQAMPYINRMYITIIDNYFENVDSVFPSYSMDDWTVTDYVHKQKDDSNEFDHWFITYERKIV